MVGTYYLNLIPYRIAWHIYKLLHKRELNIVHVESDFDYFLFRNIAKYLSSLEIAVTDRKLIGQIKQIAPKSTIFHVYPFCYPDSVVMFRNAAWKYPVRRIIKIGLEHGAYNFKRFPKPYYYNLFDLYMMTSFQDVDRLQSLGVTTVKSVGYPKSDSLFDGSYTQSMLNSLRTKLGLNPNKSTVLFSATWDGSGMSAIAKWYNRLDSLVSKYNILVTLHPRMSERYYKFLQQVIGIHFINDMDVYPYLLIADVCIGDTNSLIAEFCIVNKPIITFSIESTVRTMDDVIGLITDISIRIDSFDQVEPAIEQAIRTAQETASTRQNVIRTFINPLDGKAGWRAAQEIIRLIPKLKP